MADDDIQTRGSVDPAAAVPPGRVRRLCRFIVRAMVLFVVVAVVWVTVTNLRGSSAQQRVLDELAAMGVEPAPRRLGWPLGMFDSLDAPQPDPRQAEALRAVLAAIELADVPDAWRQGLPGLDAKAPVPQPGAAIDTTTSKRIAEALGRMASFFQVIGPAHEVESFVLPAALGDVKHADDGMPVMGGLRAFVRWWAVRCYAAQARSDAEGATDAVEAIFDMAWWARDLTTVLSTLVRVNMDASGVAALEQTLSRTQPDGGALARLREKMLRADDRYAERKRIIDAELALSGRRVQHVHHTFTEAMRQMEDHLAYLSKHDRFDPDADIAADDHPALVLRSWYGDSASKSRAALTASRLVHTVCPGRFKLKLAEVHDELMVWRGKAQLPDAAFLDWLNTKGAGQVNARETRLFVSVFLAVYQTRAMLRCAAAAVQVERYRIEHGDWPVDLGALPEPTRVDPFTGQALLYKRTDRGVIIYSVGMDQTDDGGVEPGEFAASDDPADVRFELFDPDQRNVP